MSEIVWEDPPPVQRRGGGPKPGNGKWARFARGLMDQPGRWAFVCTWRSTLGPLANVGSQGRALRNAGVDPHAFERAVRSNDDGTWSHWARYMGAHGEYADEDA